MSKAVRVFILLVFGLWSVTAVAQEAQQEETLDEESLEEGTETNDDDGGAPAPDVAREAERMAEELARQAEEERQQQQRQLTLMVTGNVDGNFARVNCREEEGYSALYWAKQAGYFRSLDETARQADLPGPIGLNVGDSIFPGALSRYLLSQGESGSQRLATLLAQVPIEAHGLGNRELDTSRQALIDFAEALEAHGVDLQAANLECEAFDGAEAVCAALHQAQNGQKFRIIERDGVRLAVTSVLAENLLDPMAQAQRQGLRVLDPKETLPSLVEEMRQEADLVVVQYHLRPGDALDRSYALASSVEGIDLMLTSHLLGAEQDRAATSQEPTGSLMSVVHAENTGTPIVSGSSTEAAVIDISLDLARSDRGWSLQSVTPRRTPITGVQPHPETADLLREDIQSFCRDWGVALGDDSTLAEPFSMADLQVFILNVMRFSTDSEVALSNQGAFRDEGQFPLTDQLTAADIYTALPYANHLITAGIKGSVLKRIAPRLANALVGTGLRVDGDRILVNGRPIVDDRFYRVALNDYLAEGGGGIFTEEDLSGIRIHHPDWSPEPPSIDELVVEYVRSSRHIQRGRVTDGVSAHNNFPDLHRLFLWSFTGALNASYNQVAVQNPLVNDAPGYDQSQFTVQSTDQINLEGRLTSQADSRNHRWNNDLNLQYATARLVEEDAQFDETKDLIRLRSRYRYQRLRADRKGVWYVPDPLVEGQLESEFSRPETRDWHRLDLRAIAGVSFQLFDPLDFRLGVNIRQDVNQPDSEPTYGVNTGYTLARISLFNLLGRPIQFESEVEYFYNDIGQDNIHELRSANRVFFAVFDQFFFTTTFNAFAFRNDPVGEFGTNTELTVGLNYQWDAAFQRF